jgi:hypothetical protein
MRSGAISHCAMADRRHQSPSVLFLASVSSIAFTNAIMSAKISSMRRWKSGRMTFGALDGLLPPADTPILQ